VVPDTAPLDRICRALTTQGLRVAPAHRGLLAPLPGRAPFALKEVAAAAAAASSAGQARVCARAVSEMEDAVSLIAHTHE
jgi:hypothetical protein